MQLGIEEMTHVKVSKDEVVEIIEKDAIKVKHIEPFSIGDHLLIREIKKYGEIDVDTGRYLNAQIVGMKYLDEDNKYELTLEKTFYEDKSDTTKRAIRTHYMYLTKSYFSTVNYGEKIKECSRYGDYKPNDFLQIIIKSEKEGKEHSKESLMKIKSVYKEDVDDEVTLRVTKTF